MFPGLSFILPFVFTILRESGEKWEILHRVSEREVDEGEEEPILKYVHTKLEYEFLPVGMGSCEHQWSTHTVYVQLRLDFSPPTFTLHPPDVIHALSCLFACFF